MAVQSAPAARAKARAPKTAEPATDAQVAALRSTARDMARQSKETGYFDRDGNPISRKNPGYRNEFDFNPREVPEGWEYQWIRHTVHGDPSESELWDMQENGWRPVPHERHAGRFGPGELQKGDLEKGKNACILRKGQLLVERPKGMCDDARNQQKRDADDQINTQYQRFQLGMPENVQRMGLESRGAIARKTNDAHDVRADFMPKHDLAIE